MATYDERIAALEKDSAIMKHDIIYKLDDTNSAVTIIKGIVGSQEQDVQYLINQMKSVNVHLTGIDLQLVGLKEEIRAIKRSQDAQGQDITTIKRSQDAQGQDIIEIKRSQDAQGKDIIEIKRLQDAQGKDIVEIKRSLQTLEGKFEQVLQLLTTMTNKME